MNRIAPHLFPPLKTSVLELRTRRRWFTSLAAVHGDVPRAWIREPDRSVLDWLRPCIVFAEETLTWALFRCFASSRIDPFFVDGSFSKEVGWTFLLTGGDVTKFANVLSDIKGLRLCSPVRPTIVASPPSLSWSTLQGTPIKKDVFAPEAPTSLFSRTRISTDDLEMAVIYVSGIFHVSSVVPHPASTF